MIEAVGSVDTRGIFKLKSLSLMSVALSNETIRRSRATGQGYKGYVFYRSCRSGAEGQRASPVRACSPPLRISQVGVEEEGTFR